MRSMEVYLKKKIDKFQEESPHEVVEEGFKKNVEDL